MQWLFLDSVWVAESRDQCRDLGEGACWAFINARWNQFVYGFYPDHLQWRVDLAFILLIVAIAPVLFDKVPARRHLMKFSLVYPVVAFFLLHGSETLGLEIVETSKFGGFMLTLVIGVTGIVASLPIGILLALGRSASPSSSSSVACR